MTDPDHPPSREAIDLSSDGDSTDSDEELEFYSANSPPEFIHDLSDLAHSFSASDEQHDPHDREVIDLTDLPDINVSPSDSKVLDEEVPAIEAVHSIVSEDVQLVSEASCLQKVLDVLPDISVNHVYQLIRERTSDATRTVAQCEQLIMYLLDNGAYPKEVDVAPKKRKREDDDDLDIFENGEPDPNIENYEREA